jgi:hypothetical protein
MEIWECTGHIIENLLVTPKSKRTRQALSPYELSQCSALLCMGPYSSKAQSLGLYWTQDLYPVEHCTCFVKLLCLYCSSGAGRS